MRPTRFGIAITLVLPSMRDTHMQNGAFGTEMTPIVEIDASLENCRIAPIKQHLYSDLNGEAVILSIKNGKYYGLNAVGSSIWKQLLSRPVTLLELQTALMNEYDVDGETCRNELLSFLRRMLGEGLLEVLDEKTV